MKQKRPKDALLENVPGLDRVDPDDPDGKSCMDKVLETLRGLTDYDVTYPNLLNHPYAI